MVLETPLALEALSNSMDKGLNGRHARRGTPWEDRFRSVLAEGRGHALCAMAAYIDLNPVRAKICNDPEDYRWCGYAEAVAGGKEARDAVAWLASLTPHGGMMPDAGSVKPKEALRKWRCHLFGIPESEARQAEELAKGDQAAVYRDRIPRDKALEVLARGGKLTQATTCAARSATSATAR